MQAPRRTHYFRPLQFRGELQRCLSTYLSTFPRRALQHSYIQMAFSLHPMYVNTLAGTVGSGSACSCVICSDKFTASLKKTNAVCMQIDGLLELAKHINLAIPDVTVETFLFLLRPPQIVMKVRNDLSLRAYLHMSCRYIRWTWR